MFSTRGINLTSWRLRWKSRLYEWLLWNLCIAALVILIVMGGLYCCLIFRAPQTSVLSKPMSEQAQQWNVLSQQITKVEQNRQWATHWFTWLPSQIMSGMQLASWKQSPYEVQWELQSNQQIPVSQILSTLKNQPNVKRVSIDQITKAKQVLSTINVERE